MKYLFLAIALVVLPFVTFGQSSGGRDPNIYLPEIGVAGVIDTIMGAREDQMLSFRLVTLPPRPDSIYGDPLIGDYEVRVRSDTVWTNSFKGGPGFNLHKPEQRSRLPFLNGNSTPYFGHFHSSKLIDLFESGINRVYWSDESGNYDTARYSDLFANNNNNLVYISYLSSDTVEDIILGSTNVPVGLHFDEEARLYRGGTALFNQLNAVADSTITYGSTDSAHHHHIFSTMTFADFRGVGRNDLLTTDDSGNLFYYRNDPPFSMQKFKDHLSDTLLSIYENPLLHPKSEAKLSRALAFPAFPKEHGDSSADLAVNYGIVGSGFSVQLFKGGPDFGTQRLFLDKADFIIPDPGLDFSFGAELTDCGDMTGTGDHVLCVQGYGDPITATFNFFATGRSLDAKMDMYFYVQSGGLGMIDTVTADADKLEDVLIGLPGFPTPEPKSSAGTVLLVHGSKLIPHVTSGVAGADPVTTNAHIWPMPFQSELNLSFNSPASEDVTTRIYNLLGQEVYSSVDRVAQGETSLKISLPALSRGTYTLSIQGKTFELKKRLVRD